MQLPGTTDPESEFRVALLRPGSATHSNDTSQRYIKVKITGIVQTAPPDSYTISVRIPLEYRTAPAGHYMVTVVSSEGVPSVAKWIRIQ